MLIACFLECYYEDHMYRTFELAGTTSNWLEDMAYVLALISDALVLNSMSILARPLKTKLYNSGPP